jgi:hypothetical protein
VLPGKLRNFRAPTRRSPHPFESIRCDRHPDSGAAYEYSEVGLAPLNSLRNFGSRIWVVIWLFVGRTEFSHGVTEVDCARGKNSTKCEAGMI